MFIINVLKYPFLSIGISTHHCEVLDFFQEKAASWLLGDEPQHLERKYTMIVDGKVVYKRACDAKCKLQGCVKPPKEYHSSFAVGPKNALKLSPV